MIKNAIAYITRKRNQTLIIFIILTIVLSCLYSCLTIMKSSDEIEKALYESSNSSISITKKDGNYFNVNEFKDIESINAYHEYVESGLISKEDMMRYLCYKSRDNARTPMQWNDQKNAGFTTGTPWIKVNPNYVEINAEEEVKRADSVFSYYKKLIALRHQEEVIVYGHYELLLPESEELYVYTRELNEEKLLVICNFTDKEVSYAVPDEFVGKEILISNYEEQEIKQELSLKPYEAIVIRR